MSAVRPGAYARAIEEALARARGRPAVLSPRDWARVADWCARGVPLPVVLEALEAAAARARRRGTEVRGLALVAPAVEESWQAVARGRIGTPGVAPLRPGADDVWRQARAGRPDDDALARWLDGARARLEDGEAPDALEEELDRSLPELASEPQRAKANSEVDRALSGFRGRMSDETFAATRRRALSDALRRALALPPRTSW